MPLTFRDALSAFAIESGLPALPDPLPSGLFELELDNGLVVRILDQEDLGAAELHCEVGGYPEFAEPEILSLLARANSSFAATAGATLGADTRARRITLSLRVSLTGSDPGSLARAISRFAEVAAEWKNILTEKSQGSRPPEPASEDMVPITPNPLHFA